MTAGCGPLAAQRSAARPNVIVIVADDQGYGDLCAHCNPRLKTPHLDRLYTEAVRLTDFHASPMCTPTRSQLMTGRDALVNSAMNVSSGRTLWHPGDSWSHRPEDRGFQEAVWFPSSHIGSASDAWNSDYFNDVLHRCVLRRSDEMARGCFWLISHSTRHTVRCSSMMAKTDITRHGRT